jgi:hypothetical protein
MFFAQIHVWYNGVSSVSMINDVRQSLLTKETRPAATWYVRHYDYMVELFTVRDDGDMTSMEYENKVLFAVPRDAFLFLDTPHT